MPPLLDALALRARGGHCALVIRAGFWRAAGGLPVYSQRDVRAPLLVGGLVRAKPAHCGMPVLGPFRNLCGSALHTLASGSIR